MRETVDIQYGDLHTEAIYERDEGNGRVFQFGRLVEPVEGYEAETHALRVKTPVKDVTFLLHWTDAGWLGLVAYVLNGGRTVNERWIRGRIGEVFE